MRITCEIERERECMCVCVCGRENITTGSILYEQKYQDGYESKDWFKIMSCASIFSVVRSSLEVSRMFHNNLEYR